MVILAFSLVTMAMCSMYPGRRLGPGRVPQQGSSSSSRPVPGGDRDDRREGEEPTGRSRTTSRDRRGDPEGDVVAALHRKLALMFMTVLEGRFTPRETVTSEGIRKTLAHLLAAARSLDDGYVITIQEALSYLDTEIEQRARRLLEDSLYHCE